MTKKVNRFKIRIVIAVFLLGAIGESVRAEEKIKIQTARQATSLADQIGDEITRQATWLDLLLAGKRYTSARNLSTAEVKQHVSWEDTRGFTNSTDVNLDVRLPNLEKRWSLRFSSYDEDEERRDASQGFIRTRAREKRPGAALVFARELGNVRTIFQPRLLVKNPLVLNYILRFQSHAENGHLKIDPQIEFFADAEKGTGQYASLEFKFMLSQTSGLSFRSEEEYSEFQNKFTTSHSLGFGYAFTDHAGMNIGAAAFSNNDPSFNLGGLNLVTTFTHVLKSDRLEYAISPFLDFPRAYGFKGLFGTSLDVILTF